MGTSGAYGGSGGRAWGQARQHASDWAGDPSDANAEQLLGNIADALDWDAIDEETEAGAVRPPIDLSTLRIHTSGGRGGSGSGSGGGGGGGGGGGVRRGRSAGGSNRRSRARAAAVGGSVAAAGLAYRERDDAALGTYGLTLVELDGLQPHEQARSILEAIESPGGGLQEDELRRASVAALLTLLSEENATGADAVRVFVVEYVFEVSLTEIGDEFRDGKRDGYATVDDEDKLRDLIEARVEQVDLPGELTQEDVQQAIYTALDDARTFLRAGQ